MTSSLEHYSPIILFNVNESRPNKTCISLLNKINPIFDMVQFTCADIYCRKMSVLLLIKIFNALPNLTSIRLSDLPLRDAFNRCVESKEILNEFSNTNRIEKVTLQKITRMKQFDRIIHRVTRQDYLYNYSTSYTQSRDIFDEYLKTTVGIKNLSDQQITLMENIDLIFDLFPRIQYLCLQHIWDADISVVVHFALWKVQMNGISHPMTICICGIQVEYDRIKTLHQMIDSENLLTNYTIHRQFNRLYIQWK